MLDLRFGGMFGEMLAFLFAERINWPFHVLFMAFFLVLGMILLILDRRRRTGLKRVARRLSMGYRRKAGDDLAIRLRLFELLRQGGRDAATQVLAGDVHGQPVWAFNFYDRRRDPLTAVRGGYVCVLIRLNQSLPSCRILPEDIRSALSDWDYERVFPGDDWLDPQVWVLAKALRPVQTMFTAAVREWHRAHPHVMVALEGECLLLAQFGELTPANAECRLDEAVSLLQGLGEAALQAETSAETTHQDAL